MIWSVPTPLFLYMNCFALLWWLLFIAICRIWLHRIYSEWERYTIIVIGSRCPRNNRNCSLFWFNALSGNSISMGWEWSIARWGHFYRYLNILFSYFSNLCNICFCSASTDNQNSCILLYSNPGHQITISIQFVLLGNLCYVWRLWTIQECFNKLYWN